MRSKSICAFQNYLIFSHCYILLRFRHFLGKMDFLKKDTWISLPIPNWHSLSILFKLLSLPIKTLKSAKITFLLSFLENGQINGLLKCRTLKQEQSRTKVEDNSRVVSKNPLLKTYVSKMTFHFPWETNFSSQLPRTSSI